MTQALTRGADGRVIQCVGDQFAGCFRTTQQGYAPNLPNNVTLYVPPDTPSGYIQSWHVSVQQKVTDNIVTDLAYVGNHGVKLSMIADINQARPPLASENANATLAARRPIQGYGTISAVLPEAFSNYHALQAKVEFRKSTSLNVLNSFTWSKAIDNVSQVLEEPGGSTGTPQNVYDIGNDRGPSGYHVPLLNVTSFVWNLPFGQGQRFGTNMGTVLNGILGGWQVSGINTMRSGRTINLRYATSGPTAVTSGLPTFLGGVALRPNVIGDPLAPEERALDRQLLQPRQRHPAAGHGAVRQRRPEQRPRLRLLSARSGHPEEVRAADPQRRLAGDSRRSVQRAEQDQLRPAQRRSQQRRVRHHPVDVPGPPAAGRRQAVLLVVAVERRTVRCSTTPRPNTSGPDARRLSGSSDAIAGSIRCAKAGVRA